MRPTVSALAAWNPDAVAQGAVAFAHAAVALESSGDELMRHFDTLSVEWSGHAASRARERVERERAALIRQSIDWSEGARRLESGAIAIAELRRQVLEVVAAARAQSLRVSNRGRVEAGPVGSDVLDWLRRLVAAVAFSHALDRALTAVDQADEEAALALTAAAGFDDPAALLAAAPPLTEPPGAPGGDPYVVGPPTRPDIVWDEDYIWGSEQPTPGDWGAALEWKAKLAGARLLRPDLGDATDAYAHYWSNTGDRFGIDYERAFDQDSAIQANVEDEIARARAGAETLIQAGNGSFSMSGDAFPTSHYPVTENWQKTIGGYQQWSSADVAVSGNKVTMTITVHAEDYYNFNRGQADIASGAPDDENGRFTEIGWAKPFETGGSLTRVVTWELGSADEATITKPPDPTTSSGR